MIRKNILISVDCFHSGGAEMAAIRLANFLSDNHKIFFLEFDSLASKDKKLKSKLNSNIVFFSPSENLLIKFIYWLNKATNFKSHNLFMDIANFYRYLVIKNFIISNKIRTVNSHAIFQNVVFSQIKKKFPSLRFVVTLHGHFEYHKQIDPLITNELMQVVIESCDHLVYLTQEQLTTFIDKGFPYAKTKRILNGFELPKNEFSIDKNIKKTSSFNLLIHTRAIVEKGWEQAIQAFYFLIDKGHDVSLTLIGDGPFLAELQTRKLHHQIQLLGFVEDVFPFIYECDLGLFPSYFFGESLPNTIIEYLYCGKPIIASNIGAIAEMMESEGEYAGELIQVQKGIPADPFLIAIEIEKYINNHSYYNKKVEIAYRAFEKFKMQHCASNYLENF